MTKQDRPLYLWLVALSLAGCGSDARQKVQQGGSSIDAAPQVERDATVTTTTPDVNRPLASGGSCTKAEQCASGFCTDGVCCDDSCAGECMSCKVAGSEGTCTPVADGQDPDNDCATEAVMTCGHDGFCDGTGSCRLFPTGTECVKGACAGKVATAQRTCDGLGTCGTAAPPTLCKPYACSAGACADKCAAAGDCETGFQCMNGQCVWTAAGPLVHWKFDEGTGAMTVDSVGNSGLGMLTAGATWLTGGFPGSKTANPFSLKFNGINGEVNFGPGPLLANLRRFSVSAWINPQSSGEMGLSRIVDKRQLTVGFGWQVFLCGTIKNPECANGIRLSFRQGFAQSEGAWDSPIDSIKTNVWQHVVVTYDSSSVTNDPAIYINGLPVTVTKLETPAGTPMSDVGIPATVGGKNMGGRAFDGSIDDVRIYNRMLSAAEVASIYAGEP